MGYKNPLEKKLYQKKWRENHPNYFINWEKRNKDKRKIYYKKHFKIYYLKNKKSYQERWIKWRDSKKNIDKYKIDWKMSGYLSSCLKRKQPIKNRMLLFGYTIIELKKYIETQFDDKMNWDNYGSYWWIDHIKPKSLFKYNTIEDPNFKKCWELKNLRPLEKKENLIKKNKIIDTFVRID